MATIRESLKKLVEVAKPVPGDEQEFVAKHGMKVMDFQGKDSISTESPSDLIRKNVDYIKGPGQGERANDDHGHDAPGESEAAYHIPESRDAKIAKLSEMMGMMGPSYENGKDEDEDEDEDEDKKEVKEAKKQVVGVEMHYKHATKKPFKVTHFSVQDAERGRKDYEKMGYKLVGKKAQMGEEAEQVDEGAATHHGVVVDSSSLQKPKNISGLARQHGGQHAYRDPHGSVYVFSNKDGAKSFKLAVGSAASHIKAAQTRQIMKIKGLGEAVEQVDENLPLLPKQKQIARDLLKKEMEARKKQRNDNRQAGTPKLMEEDRRDANNEVRRHIMATPRLVHKADTFKKMKDMLQSVNKHDNVGS